MFEPFADVPLYPLVFPVFWGAAAFFALAMARHLRVFAAARNASPTDRPLARLAGTDPLRDRPDADVPRPARPGILHAGIFWGFVLLTIGTANIVTGGLIQAILVDPVRRRAVGRGHGDAERRRGRSCSSSSRGRIWRRARRRGPRGSRSTATRSTDPAC